MLDYTKFDISIVLRAFLGVPIIKQYDNTGIGAIVVSATKKAASYATKTAFTE